MEPRPIKVIRILSRMNIGGPAIHAVLLTEGLNDTKIRSTLVTGTVGQSEGDMAYFAKQHGVAPLIVPELGREISWVDDVIALFKLYRILVRERPDIVHTHTAKAGTLGRLAAVLARVPIKIHTFHGHIFHHYFSPLKTKVFLAIERFLARFTTKIVVISSEQLADLSDRYHITDRSKILIIPLGLDLTSFFLNQDRIEERNSVAEKQEVVVGLIGRLVPIKNPSMALRVFERLVREGGALQSGRLIVAGDGELRTALQEQAMKAALESRILFTGWQQNLVNLYARLDMVILTSLNEGTPVVLIEAMAAGLPFVATRVGGVLDLMVGPKQVLHGTTGRPLFSLYANGALVESQDEEGFAAAVAYLIRDREGMRRMGAQGRQFVKKRFSTERLLRDTEALYQHCCARQTISHPGTA